MAPSGVYFDLQAFGADKYGRLGKGVQSVEAAAQPQRVGDGDAHTDADKRHSADFALWKRGNPGDATWEAPFGAGRPGWCDDVDIGVSGAGAEVRKEDLRRTGGGVE